MRFAELAARVPSNGLFRTGQILAGERSPADLRRQLHRWTRSGRILQLRRGVYVLRVPYAKASAHPFAVAGALKRASYVSLHSALAYHGMIPEFVPVTTSVTSGRPEEIETPYGRFQFRHVSARLLFGFSEVEIAPGQRVLLASAAKALVDLLYLTPHSDREAYLRELRVEPAGWFDRENLRETVQRAGSRKVERAVRLLLERWDDEEAGA